MRKPSIKKMRAVNKGEVRDHWVRLVELSSKEQQILDIIFASSDRKKVSKNTFRKVRLDKLTMEE